MGTQNIGTRLKFQSADQVVQLDPKWKPKDESQAKASHSGRPNSIHENMATFMPWLQDRSRHHGSKAYQLIYSEALFLEMTIRRLDRTQTLS